MHPVPLCPHTATTAPPRRAPAGAAGQRCAAGSAASPSWRASRGRAGGARLRPLLPGICMLLSPPAGGLKLVPAQLSSADPPAALYTIAPLLGTVLPLVYTPPLVRPAFGVPFPCPCLSLPPYLSCKLALLYIPPPHPLSLSAVAWLLIPLLNFAHNSFKPSWLAVQQLVGASGLCNGLLWSTCASERLNETLERSRETLEGLDGGQ